MLAMGGAVARPTVWNFQSQIVQTQDSNKPEVKDIQKRMQTVIKFEFGRQVDALENIKNSAKRWGNICGFDAAEAFQIVQKIQM